MIELVSIQQVADALADNHYLGPAKRGFALRYGSRVVVMSNPSSRMLPHDRWLELTRWLLDGRGDRSSGSQMWAEVRRWLLKNRQDITTVVSYSDPSVGHTGALYRSCNWLWAPTWHRLRPPPTGNGSWDGKTTQATKDRWVCPLRVDAERAKLLVVKDKSILRKRPELRWQEPRFKRNTAVPGTGGVPFHKVARLGAQATDRPQDTE
jgi:hypothetical protein